jgi:hypothetical protein
MASIEEVERFLAEFKLKLSIWGLLSRDDRGKNSETLRQLEMIGSHREKILKELNSSQYCGGPISDTLNKGPALWTFGVIIKSREIYIKVSLGFENGPAHCISFHIAEYSLHYPYK